MSEPERLEINWTNSAGAALGAVSAAVVLSSLGTAGTLIGAAMGSLCITIGGAIYAHSLRMTKRRVAAARTLAARRQARARDRGSAAATGQPAVVPEPATVETSPEREALEGESRLEMLRGLPWKQIALASASLFAITMAAILVFELSLGRPVSALTGGTDSSGGTSVPGLGGGRSDSRDPGPEEQERQDEAPEEEPPAVQQEDPAEPEQDPTPQEESTPAEPTPLPLESTSP